MKILYHHRTGSKDGQAVHVEELISALRQRGHDVIVVAPATTERQEIGQQSGLVSALKRHLPKAIYEAADAGLRQRLGAGAAQAIVDRGLTWNRNAERVEALIARLASGRADPAYAAAIA